MSLSKYARGETHADVVEASQIHAGVLIIHQSTVQFQIGLRDVPETPQQIEYRV